ncbi:MAG: 8-amino-7-oxononanoate synthase [Pseudomonadota bacterium]
MARPHPLEVLSARLERRGEQGLARRLVSIGAATGPRVRVEGRDCLLMASNDYLGLAGHPRLVEAALEATLTCGTGSGASRLVSGTLEAHQELEAAIADFKGSQAALFFSTGYMANLGVIGALAGPGDLIVSDELNHASLIDACRLSRATVKVYPHRDVAAAARLLEEAPRSGLALLVTDGVFSMDGDLAPLPELLDLARAAGALLVIDDAHATGVWGARGRGTLEHFGLEFAPEVAMVGTFSKALGGLGGFVAGSRLIIDSLVNLARPFLYTTAPPPAQAAVALASLGLVDEEPWRRDKLRELCQHLRSRLAGLGLNLLSQEGAIVPILVGSAEKSLAMGRALLDQGVLAPAIRPPTVPAGTSRIRLTVTAAHQMADMEQAARAIAQAAQEAEL